MTYLWVSVVGRVIGFWVSNEIYKKYVLLSEEDKERIKHFIELLVEILSSGYNIKVKEKEEKTAESPEPSTSELIRRGPVTILGPSTTPALTGTLQKIFNEWRQILIDKGFAPGHLYKCQELQIALSKSGVKEYAFEVLVKHGLIIRDNDECVLK